MRNPYDRKDYPFAQHPVFEVVMGAWDIFCITTAMAEETKAPSAYPMQAVCLSVGWALQATADGILIGDLAASSATAAAFVRTVRVLPGMLPELVHGPGFWNYLENNLDRFPQATAKIIPFRS